MNYGFVKPTIRDTDYIRRDPVLGGKVPDEILNPSGDWRGFLPVVEQQKKAIETYACTAFGTENALEILHKKKFSFEKNWSDRCLAIMANIKPPGAEPNLVCDIIREKGLLDEIDLPFLDSMTIEQFFSPNPIPDYLLERAKNWGYTMKHEWLSNGTKINEADLEADLKLSPIGIAVDAWRKEGDYYVRKVPDNHWVVLVARDPETKGWWIFDSYPTERNLKLLAPDYGFYYAKRFWLYRGITDEKKNRTHTESYKSHLTLAEIIKQLEERFRGVLR